MTPDDAPRHVLAAALASLRATPAQLRRLVLNPAGLRDSWERVLAGDVDALAGRYAIVDRKPTTPERWQSDARRLDLAGVASRIAAASARVRILGDADYPALLSADGDPPAVLFERAADSDLVDRLESFPRVAIVGTRRCTNYGLEVAREVGRDLAAAGVCIVSGLAAGIDGAAHEGALIAGGAPPIAVVGSGVDVVYPRRHRRLWSQVAEAGVLLSESSVGAAPEGHRFPLRNRIIAALADVVVVVESHAAGGSMLTVQAAIDRGVPVMAVPGSVRSPSSAGTNRLLADGVAPVLDGTDVLVALSLGGSSASRDAPPPEGNPRPELDAEAQRVLDAVEWTPTAMETVLHRTGLGLGAAAALLTRLEMDGLVRSRAGWWERHEEVRSSRR